MFVFIRRHQGWGLIFIAIVILSFVVFFTPDARFRGRGDGGRGADYGSINGKAISSDEYFRALKEAKLEFLLRYRTWPEEDATSRQLGYDQMRQTINRIVLIKKLNEYHIEATDQAVADQIADYFQDRARSGGFDLQTYEKFVRERLLPPPGGITRNEFEEFVRHEVGIQQLISLTGINGELIAPREAEAEYRKENELVSTQFVPFSASNFLAQVTVDPAALSQFYTNREAVYRIPERIQVSYVKFDLTNVVAEADQLIAKDIQTRQLTNLNQMVEMIYQQQGTNVLRNEQNEILPETAAKEKIKQEIQQAYALQAARKKAAAFAKDLYNQPAQADSLDKLAAAHGYQAQVSEPFTAAQVPPGLKVSRDFTEKAFKLSPEAPFTTAIVGEDGVYVIALKQRLMSAVPPFEQIQDAVTTDYRTSQARELARQAGMQFYNVLTNGLAQGKSFETVCAEANNPPIQLPSFSAQTRSLSEVENIASFPELKNAAFTLEPGKASNFIPTRQGGFIVHVKARLPVPEDQMKTEFPEFIAGLRQERKYAAFNDWFSKEVEKADLKMPSGYKASAN